MHKSCLFKQAVGYSISLYVRSILVSQFTVLAANIERIAEDRSIVPDIDI